MLRCDKYFDHSVETPCDRTYGLLEEKPSRIEIKTNDYFHYLHHKHFECNYGAELVPLDAWLGTFHDGSKEAEKRMNERFMQRSREARASSA